MLPDQSTPNESAKVIEESELLPPRRRSSTDVIPRAPDPVDIHTIIDARQGSDRRFLLKYYTQILTGLVSTNHENNSFLSGEQTLSTLSAPTKVTQCSFLWRWTRLPY